jgi:hypothetical protein
MIAIVFITFCSTTLSVQDGFGRMFADGTNILFQGFGVQGRWTNEKFLRKAYIVGLLAVLPIGIYLFFGQPIALLQLAGGIEAAHIPIVTGLTLYLIIECCPRNCNRQKSHGQALRSRDCFSPCLQSSISFSYWGLWVLAAEQELGSCHINQYVR